MYSNQSFDEKVTSSSKRNEDFDLCNTETRKKFLTNISPQYCARYLSKNRYASPRSVSKSVPRRKRGIVRYNFNRSLNFDVGARKSDNFKSPNSSSDSHVPVEGDQYLSRSAKILRALNINCSPLQGTKLSGRKINKSLNFDLSPSPKRLTPFGKSPRNNSLKTYPSPMSKINKTLNFDTSSNDSNILTSSVESIDENQNQTPSQRNRSAKKSLNYLSPGSEKSFGSSDSDVQSSMLRSGLKTKIDNIVLTSMTPNMQSAAKRMLIQSKFDNFGASTPRNLYNDFEQDDDDDVDDRPQTPENVIKIIPEGMSAIKKSHKKERVLGRLGKAVAYQESCSGIKAFTDIDLDIPHEESRPITPSITIDQYQSPQCGMNSIKQSHKKDKSKRKSFVYHSEEEMSDTGSIFDYTEEANMMDSDSLSPRDKSDPNSKLPKIRVSSPSEEDKELKGEENSPVHDKSEGEGNDSLGEIAPLEEDVVEVSATASCSFDSPEALRDANILKMQREQIKQITNPPSPPPSDDTVKTPPRNSTTGNTLRPVTPENRINFLQRIMTNSIKKSHKKIKDSNKKLLYKPRIIHNDMEEARKREHEENEDPQSPEEGDRAGTPENTNSSRLLLSQFSSVKKSHRKDKHKRILAGSIRRKKVLSRECEVASNSDNEDHNCSFISSTSDLPNLSPPRISPRSTKRRKSEGNDFSSDNSSDAHYQTFDTSLTKDDLIETGIGELPSSKHPKSSPNKRKNFLNISAISGGSQSSSNPGSISIEYESAEEEFKIYTPIKKRKSLTIVAPTARRICENNDLSPEKAKSMDEASTENSASRCSTPITARSKNLKLVEGSFKTPERNACGVLLTVTDYSSPVLQEIDNVDNPSGRSTPQNSSTSVLMASINSIKKSHKKDKRGNISRRSLICAQEEAYEAEATSSLEKDLSKSSSQSHGSPQPSTSYGTTTDHAIVEPDNEIGLETKTPPNCFKVKTYLRLLQTASIKRSHKKVRDRKKFKSICVDPELSDDGSLFDEAEKSVAMENESLKSREEKENDGLSAGSPKMEGDRDSQKRKGDYYHQDEELVHYSGNLSDDGSIFDSEEKLENPFDIGNGDEQESSPV